jgi:VCBS repeat-containing protein
MLVADAPNGSVVVNPDGTYTYTPDPDFNGTDSFTFKANDGAADSNTATITVLVAGENDAPINGLPATFELEANVPAALTGLSVTDDSGAGVITTTLTLLEGIIDLAAIGGATVTGSGTNVVTIEGTLAQINATLGAPDNVRYTAPRDFFGPDPLIMTTDDHGFTGAGGAKSDTDQSTIFMNTFTRGTLGDDSFHALPGNQYIITSIGTDTVSFDFALTDATVTYRGHIVIIDGPSSHTLVSGVENYAFTDGEVHNGDEDRLVDDLFYYAANHDVWNARVDADEHYHVFGRHEGRDPSAVFDTSFYLARYPDIAAAGVDPLRHFDETGWKEGRVPSLQFDPGGYLAAYPDIAAAQIDPLAHFLAHGTEEGRPMFPPTGLIAPNGFHYAYYLLHNPDVAAAGVDPLEHFNTSGWKEGRKPNAFFDTDGYLAQYADVAAAGVNPLDHYHDFGWREGRDPSVGFDTGSYLAAYSDVAAADRDPLQHYLEFGIHEGRSTFPDGVWG